jgi:hypothetical protein
MYVRTTIVVVFLSLFFFKVSAFHVYAHQQNTDYQVEACGYCDLAVENQQTELAPAPAAPEISTPYPKLPVTQITLPPAVIASSPHPGHLFTRPPPTAG